MSFGNAPIWQGARCKVLNGTFSTPKEKKGRQMVGHIELSTILAIMNLIGVIAGLGMVYGKLQSTISEMKKWQERHEAENKNALDRIDKRIAEGDIGLNTRISSVESRILFDDGSARYVKIADCSQYRAQMEICQKNYYNMLEKMVTAYHAESSAERKEVVKVVNEISNRLNIMIATCEMEKK